MVAEAPGEAQVPILWLYGADAVGKTTVAWSIYERLTGQGFPMAFVDTDYLRFCQPGFDSGPARLVELNLGSMWTNFSMAGARSMVVAGVVVTADELERYRGCIPGGALTLCRLRASEAEIAERIVHRRRLEQPRADGFSQDVQRELADYAQRAAGFADHLEREDFADVVVDTTGRTVTEIADEVLAGAGGWLSAVDPRSEGLGRTPG